MSGIGYLLLLGLIVVFYYLGFRGFSTNGLPVTKKITFKGPLGQIIGGILILIGTSILGAASWDFVATHVVPPKTSDPVAAQPELPPQVVKNPPEPEQLPQRPVDSDGFYLDVRNNWTNRFGVMSSSLYRDPSGEVYFGEPKGPIIVSGFSSFLQPADYRDLPEPNAPFGLHIGCSDSDAALKEIRRFKNLKAVSISFTKVSNPGLENLKDLPKLEYLLLYSVKSIEGDFGAIGGCEHLVYLQLGNTNVTDASLKEIGRLAKLKELMLFSTPITDSGLQYVSKLEGLQVLILQGTKVSDSGLKHLSGLKQLRKLDLHSTSVSDAGLKYVAELQNLEELNLVLTNISDDGLSDLIGLKRLRRIQLLATKVTDKGVAKLTAALPDLAVGIR